MHQIEFVLQLMLPQNIHLLFEQQGILKRLIINTLLFVFHLVSTVTLGTINTFLQPATIINEFQELAF